MTKKDFELIARTIKAMSFALEQCALNIFRDLERRSNP